MVKAITYLIGFSIVTPVLLGVILVLGLYNAWAIETLWTWFGTPLTGITISFGQAAGVWLLASYLKSYKHRPDEESKHALIYELIQPGALVLVGALVHYWFF